VLEELALERVQLPGIRQALHGHDLAALGLEREVGARVHGAAVEQHHAGAALGVVATLLAPGHAQLGADNREQGSVRLDLDGKVGAVDVQDGVVSHGVVLLYSSLAPCSAGLAGRWRSVMAALHS